MPKQQPETTAITSGRDDSGSLAPALWSSSTWQSNGFEESKRNAVATHSLGNYSRYANPTVRAFEHSIAELEGAQDALAFASGMGAVSSVILALCSTGDHIVAQRQIYGGTISFLNGPCQRLGIDVTYVDGTQPGAFVGAIKPGKTMLVLAESPSNPLMEISDFAELGSIKGPFTMVDSTIGTPLGQRPLDFGISLALHSATKSIGGHNDATLGVIAGAKEIIDAIWGYAVMHGASASPHDALNGLRGIRTLGVRLAHQCQSAQRIAEALSKSPTINAVHYPGLDSFPQHQLAVRQMRMFGSVLSFEVRGGTDAARRVVDGVRLVRPAASFGGPETLICHTASTTHVGMDPAAQKIAGITDGLIRISVGLEATDDIIADLKQALLA
ncbi:MAG: aminotransferase class I/II-fold pyridoxal phosphate-dependent enzyme [Ilumatobacteraceae bacterium]